MGITNTLYKFNDNHLPTSFVSIAVQVDGNLTPDHAAILIRLKGVNYLHHYPGNKPPELIKNFDESGWYLYKIIDSIRVDDDSEVEAFLAYCYRVCKKSNITYSYIHDNSYYDINGNSVSVSGLPELGTCVGFCINTLSTALVDVDKSLVHLDDWDNSNLNAHIDAYGTHQSAVKYPNMDWSLYNAFKKRITPLEYLCIAFIEAYPVRKSDIEKIKNDITQKINCLYQ